MKISAVNKFSLIDYPGEVSCIVFTPWCNFRCGFCHNSEFVLPKKIEKIKKDFIPEKAFLNFLEKRVGFLSGVSICGGEPTIHNDLPEFCKKIKKMWYLIKLDTNGRAPEMIKKLLDDKLVDYIAMDIKNEIWKFSESAWVKLDEKPYLKSIQLIMDSNIDYEFRTTVIKWIHTKKTIENITKYIVWAKNYYLQNYKDWNLLDKNFIWESFSRVQLLEFKNIWEKYIRHIWIRY
jgi:pyruvate formate lyase activating enzyme